MYIQLHKLDVSKLSIFLMLNRFTFLIKIKISF